jgi:hypothetical protein
LLLGEEFLVGKARGALERVSYSTSDALQVRLAPGRLQNGGTLPRSVSLPNDRAKGAAVTATIATELKNDRA